MSQHSDHQHPPAGAGESRRDSFFDSVRRIGVVRAERRWIGGVAAGLAKRWNVDPLLVRGALVVLSVFSGLGLLLYGLAWALLPEERDGRIHLHQALRGRFDAGLAGALITTVVGLSRPGFWWGPYWWYSGWTAVLLVLALAGVLLAGYWLGRRYQQPRPPSTPSQPAADPAGTRDQPAATSPPAPAAGGQGDEQAAETAEHTGHPPTHSAGTAAEEATVALSPAVESTPHTHGSARPAATADGGSYRADQNAGRATPPAATATPTVPEQRVPGPGSTTVRVFVGLSLLAAAVLALLGRMSDADAHLGLLAGGAILAVLGLGILISGIRGRRPGWLGAWSFLTTLFVLPLTLVLAIAPQVRESLTLDPAMMGQEHWAPTSEAALQDGRAYTFGELDVSLMDVPPDSQISQQVPISLAAGVLVLRVPEELDVAIEVRGTGALQVDSDEPWFRNGQELQRPYDIPLVLNSTTLRPQPGSGPADIELVVGMGAGTVLVEVVPGRGASTEPDRTDTGSDVDPEPETEPGDATSSTSSARNDHTTGKE